MKKVKIYLFVLFCVVISVTSIGCGTIRGVGSDISALGEILAGY